MAPFIGCHCRRRHHVDIVIHLLCTYFAAQGYDVYMDEYQNEYLPGSVKDSRGLPNSPFDVDVNRLADGMSSRSILTTTSPAFPRYRGVLFDPESRREHYMAVKQSETFQGERLVNVPLSPPNLTFSVTPPIIAIIISVATEKLLQLLSLLLLLRFWWWWWWVVESIGRLLVPALFSGN